MQAASWAAPCSRPAAQTPGRTRSPGGRRPCLGPAVHVQNRAASKVWGQAAGCALRTAALARQARGPVRVVPGQLRKIARDKMQCWSARTARHGRPSTHDAAYMPGQQRLDRETRTHAMQAAAGWGRQGAEKQLQDGSRQPGCPRIRRASRGISTKSRSRVQLKAARTASPGRLALTSTL